MNIPRSSHQCRFHSHNKFNSTHYSITIQLIHASGIDKGKLLTPYGSSSCPNASKEHLTLLLVRNFKSFTKQKQKQKIYNHILANSNLHILLLSIQQLRQLLLIYSLSLLCTPKSSPPQVLIACKMSSCHAWAPQKHRKTNPQVHTTTNTWAYPKHCTHHNWNSSHTSSLLLSMMKNKKDAKLYQHRWYKHSIQMSRTPKP